VSYEVQISRNYLFTRIVQQPTINDALEYTAAALTPNATYYWRARSINIYGEKGKWSGYRSFKVTQ
jgi:squalene cyclase